MRDDSMSFVGRELLSLIEVNGLLTHTCMCEVHVDTDI